MLNLQNIRGYQVKACLPTRTFLWTCKTVIFAEPKQKLWVSSTAFHIHNINFSPYELSFSLIQHTKSRSEIIAELKQTVSINVKPSRISHEVLPYLIEPKQITENYGTFGEYGIKSCLLVACIRKQDYSAIDNQIWKFRR